MSEKARFLLALASGFFALGCLTSFAAASKVTRIEPPSWWVGHSHNPVRLLVSGENLTGARLEAPGPFQLGVPRVSENGKWMFVDLKIPQNAQPGTVPLRLAGDKAGESFQFQLLARLPLEDRASGISRDDVIYLILIDRFANGDESNDTNIDRKNPRDRLDNHAYH